MNFGQPVLLEFAEKLNQVGSKRLSDGLSAVVHIGNDLWVANDESTSIERLTLLNNDNEGIITYGQHQQFQIENYITLPVGSKNAEGKTEEIDIEGLDFKDGYLWLIGSHSLKRKKPDDGKTDEKKFKQLAKVSSDGNRFLLARIPLEEIEGTHIPKKETLSNGNRLTAAKLPGNGKAMSLQRYLQKMRI